MLARRTARRPSASIPPSGTATATDRGLLDAWRAGDELAGNRFVRRHFDMIFRFFALRLEEDVADLVQSTFLACLESGDRVRNATVVRAYLLGIARKKLLMHLRSKRRRARVVETRPTTSPTSTTSPSAMQAVQQEQRLLLDGLRELPTDLQIVVVLHYWEELPLVEIAVVIETPVGTVKSRLRRAREHLRRWIETYAPSPRVADSTLHGFERWARSARDLLGRDERGAPVNRSGENA